MHFEKDFTYHVYNRSNETVFYNKANYIFFLQKIKKHISPFCDIISYCLMPNHFHFLIVANKKSIEYTGESHRKNTQKLSKQLSIVLSSYTQAINKKENRKGALFAHKTTAKQLNFSQTKNNYQLSKNYLETCFLYIHQNPYSAEIVEHIEDWEFSSFRDYANNKKGNIINIALAKELINLDWENFIKQSYINLNDNDLRNIW